MNTCSICGIEIPVGRRSFCDNCKNVTFVCEGCGKQVTQYRPRYERVAHHFCSVKCSRWHVAKGAGIARTMAAGGQATVICPNCGKANLRKRSHAKRIFCNASCWFEYRRNHPETYPGHSPTDEQLAKLKNRIGPNNPMYGRTGDKCKHWKGGRTSFRGKGWRTIRTIIKRRDEYRCAVCGKHHDQLTQLDVHHIVDWSETPINHPHNLLTLCATCHQGDIHGPQPTLSNRQLAILALESTLARLGQDDLQLLLLLDRQQRGDKEVPLHIAEMLSLPDMNHG